MSYSQGMPYFRHMRSPFCCVLLFGLTWVEAAEAILSGGVGAGLVIYSLIRALTDANSGHDRMGRSPHAPISALMPV